MRDYSICISYVVLVFYLLTSCNCNACVQSNGYVDPLGYSDDKVGIDLSCYLENGVYVIRDTIDLRGNTFELPRNSKFRMQKGAFKNGVLIGNNTELSYSCDKVVFNRVHIKGIWIVPKIRSSMFSDLSYDNALKDVIALTNPRVENKVIISKGEYRVTARENSDICLLLTDNTELQLDGNVVLTPNSFTSYSIIQTNGNNIIIKGKGTICGDKDNHRDSKGEWGMGLYIRGGSNLRIKDLVIKDCWGDCIYITGNADKVVVKDCIVENGRRQGISIISAHNVVIKDCQIKNVSGTKPEYAIDIEPNKGNTVKKVVIDNVHIVNCRGGIASYGGAEGSLVDSVIIRNSDINITDRCPINLTNTSYVDVKNNQIRNSKTKLSVNLADVDYAIINNIRVDKRKLDSTKISDGFIKIKNVKQQRIK